MEKIFNIIVAGVGGQGIVTLLKIIDEAAFLQGYDVKSSELHGLSQRGGQILAHIRFGKKVYSPMVYPASADLIIGSELSEFLRALPFCSDKTKIIANKKLIAYLGGLPENDLSKMIPVGAKVVDASKIVLEKFGNEAFVAIYLLGLAVKNNFLPLKHESVKSAIKKIIAQKYQELNIKALNLAIYG